MKAESNVIEIGEYKYEDIQGLNIPKDVNYLDKFFKSTPCKVTEIKDNKVRAENTSYAGIIQLDKTRIHFSTKVKSNLFYMLSFLKDEKEFHFDSDIIIDIKEGQNFFDILGRLFLNELEEIFKKGFYKKYVRKEENLSFLKGKMLFSKQLINDIRKTPKFYCSYEDLTYDNLENQIVLKATALLIPLIRFNDKIKSELIRYRYILNEEVILRNVLPEECNRVQYNKLNECYEPIIQFSRAVLQYHFIRSAHKGASKGFNFIVNMNITASKGGSSLYQDKFSNTIEQFRFKLIYDTINEIINRQLKDITSICVSCINKWGHENNLYIYLDNIEDDKIIYTIKDFTSKIDNNPFVYNFAVEIEPYSCTNPPNFKTEEENLQYLQACIDFEASNLLGNYNFIVNDIPDTKIGINETLEFYVQSSGINKIFYDSTFLFDIDTKSGLINFTPDKSDVGNYTIWISVKDFLNEEIYKSFNLEIEE